MAFIVEDGSGLTEANSYVSLEWANAYFQTSMDRADWDFLDDDDKKAALIAATAIIDDFWDFNGTVRSYTQALQLPRYGMPDRSGRSLIQSNQIPIGAKQAVADLALFMRKQKDSGVTETSSSSSDAVSKIEVGPIAVTMAGGSSGSSSSTTASTAAVMPRSVFQKLRSLGLPRYGYGSGRLIR